MLDRISLLAIGEYGFYAIYIWRIILISMGFLGSAGQFRRRGHATSHNFELEPDIPVAPSNWVRLTSKIPCQFIWQYAQ